MKPQKSREVIRELKAQGWVLARNAKGSHEIWQNSRTGQKVSVPAGNRHISPGVLAQLERAGVTIPKGWK